MVTIVVTKARKRTIIYHWLNFLWVPTNATDNKEQRQTVLFLFLPFKKSKKGIFFLPFDKVIGVISVTSSNKAFGVELAANEHNNLTLDGSLAADNGIATSIGLWKRRLRGSIATKGENLRPEVGQVNLRICDGIVWTCNATFIFFWRAPWKKLRLFYNIYIIHKLFIKSLDLPEGKYTWTFGAWLATILPPSAPMALTSSLILDNIAKYFGKPEQEIRTTL